jgi:hypothetical protein
MPEIRAWRNAGKGSLWFAPFVALARVKPLGLGAKDRIALIWKIWSIFLGYSRSQATPAFLFDIEPQCRISPQPRKNRAKF